MDDKPTAEIKMQTEESVTEAEEEMMQIVYHESPVIEVRSETIAEEPVIPTAATIDSPMAAFDEAEAQKLRAAERLYKLRNLSFNFNAADPNNEYDSIPAYVRHNLQVHNTTLASVEKFYSSYSVGTDDQNNTQISTINTFLEGKKPD
jgi:cell division protein FtsZ